ncbi:hypothetical protein EVB94_212 [Rhizobium phage RHph_TM40]|uniref:Uncharacterized protein n=2 Tax=Cuauhnahuacvirus TaxID=3044696 RepID=A0A7S5UXR5_9CAUD|nr:hypothetical protein PQC16_gp213 [Rhizobium phage RHph_TM30]YP_010671362.1 hypothetical protein PQC17_gp213 [Rhizobium phage RHph_Y65]QIG71683.1 hypothetical protein EVB94_212 [Rhizobium phage RHph_TM40]QIG72046.1 hypothetical protein EVB95_212 [Rhizobium phage RHph_TM2_3B]QIG72409.1 hypothetical protein EVB96_213 [Rhizobium phage RHph_TM3_3_6]QIG77799.1 hypothetical protein EVB64_212 [Rhizobium phage RHph_TM61]QIG71320.1 hypothetical protein EVB93_213 [Rhizobium phage RHph_TM30]
MSRADDIINIVNYITHEDSIHKKAAQAADKIKSDRKSAWDKDLERLKDSGSTGTKY